MTSTWETTAVPILRYVEGVEGTGIMAFDDVATSIDATSHQVANEIARLISAGYMDGTIEGTIAGDDSVMRPRLLERGSRAIGQWPSEDSYDGLLELIEERIADPAADIETRGKLRAFADVLGEIGKGTAQGVLTSYIQSRLGF